MTDDLLCEFCDVRDDFRFFWSHRNEQGVTINDGLREWVKEMRRLRSLIHPQMVSIDINHWKSAKQNAA